MLSHEISTMYYMATLTLSYMATYMATVLHGHFELSYMATISETWPLITCLLNLTKLLLHQDPTFSTR